MIRKNLLLCKIFRIKTSSKSLFDSYMAMFQPHIETCPICGSIGNCHIHDYSSYSLLFILRLLGQYFAGRVTIEQLCERYEVSPNQFYKWLSLWKTHKQEWLGILSDLETSDVSFLRSILLLDSFSSFAMGFVLRFAYSFLQSHRNPVPVSLKNAQYHQKVFAPDISIF